MLHDICIFSRPPTPHPLQNSAHTTEDACCTDTHHLHAQHGDLLVYIALYSKTRLPFLFAIKCVYVSGFTSPGLLLKRAPESFFFFVYLILSSNFGPRVHQSKYIFLLNVIWWFYFSVFSFRENIHNIKTSLSSRFLTGLFLSGEINNSPVEHMWDMLDNIVQSMEVQPQRT